MKSRDIQRKYAYRAPVVTRAIKALGLPVADDYSKDEVNHILMKIKEQNPTNVKDALIAVLAKLNELVDELKAAREIV